MSRSRLTVVLSQAPGKHPAKRSLEESIAAALIMEPGLDVSIVPNLYDLGPDHTGRLYLSSVHGDLVVLTWHFPRAAFWLLDRIGIQGHEGESLIKPPTPVPDEDDEEGQPPPAQGIGAVGTMPERHIYCLDLRDRNSPEPFLTEIRRIAAECRERNETRQTESAKANQPLLQLGLPAKPPLALDAFTPEKLLATPNRRWYPVIDYGRCTNCLECLDFCLFGVYGVDKFDRILVDAPCSGLGVLRRHPESKAQRQESTFARHQILQGQILESLAPCLRPGGVLVYSTCSTEPEETEEVVNRFCKTSPGWMRESVAPWLPPAARSFMTEQGALSTMCNRIGMDGFYAVRLRNMS